MKIGGVDVNAHAEGWANIPREDGGYRLRVRAYPLDFDVDDIFPLPDPPRVKARRISGKVERDGNSVVWDVNPRDPRYLARRAELYQARVACLFARATVHGDGEGCVDFSTPVSDETEEQYRALFAELTKSGFTAGDLTMVIDRARAISNMSEEAIEEAKAGFSQEGARPPSDQPETSSSGDDGDAR